MLRETLTGKTCFDTVIWDCLLLEMAFKVKPEG